MVVRLGVLEIGILGVIRLGMDRLRMIRLGVGGGALLGESRDCKRQRYEDCRDDLLHGPNVARRQTLRYITKGTASEEETALSGARDESATALARYGCDRPLDRQIFAASSKLLWAWKV